MYGSVTTIFFAPFTYGPKEFVETDASLVLVDLQMLLRRLLLTDRCCCGMRRRRSHHLSVFGIRCLPDALGIVDLRVLLLFQRLDEFLGIACGW